MLVLCGPPGVGKTTIGRICAQRLRIPFVDTDEALVELTGSTVAALLEREGEAALREREHRLIEALDREPRILAVGGGLITVPKTRQLLRDRALLIGLDASLPELLSRLSQSAIPRPLLWPTAAETLPALLERRESAYRDVHVRIQTDGLMKEQLAETVCLLYRQLYQHSCSHSHSHSYSHSCPQISAECGQSPESQRQFFGDSEVVYTDELPDQSDHSLHFAESLLIYDQRLESIGNRVLAEWLAAFPVRYPVTAGESLKDLTAFPFHVQRLLERLAPLPATRSTVVALGGGSVGDFAGFFASVCKRGLPLIQIPSTWLAAIDSAHGGKNALNVGLMKNQLGTIAFARRIILSKQLLCGQPKERAQEAMGELAKIAIIDGGPWVKELLAAPETDGDLLWRFLSCAVAAKYKVVLSDPLERLSVRHQLNLGHTIGHILETQHQLPHGLAVAQGLHFALELSTERGLLNAADLQELQMILTTRFALPDRRHLLAPIPQSQFVKQLLSDKKRSTEQAIRFVLVRGIGQAVIEEISVAELVAEAIRQGYVCAG